MLIQLNEKDPWCLKCDLKNGEKLTVTAITILLLE